MQKSLVSQNTYTYGTPPKGRFFKCFEDIMSSLPPGDDVMAKM